MESSLRKEGLEINSSSSSSSSSEYGKNLPRGPPTKRPKIFPTHFEQAMAVEVHKMSCSAESSLANVTQKISWKDHIGTSQSPVAIADKFLADCLISQSEYNEIVKIFEEEEEEVSLTFHYACNVLYSIIYRFMSLVLFPSPLVLYHSIILS